MAPAVGNLPSHPLQMWPHERTTVTALCEELGLGMCGGSRDSDRIVKQLQREVQQGFDEGAVRADKARRLDIGIPLQLKLKDLSDDPKRLICLAHVDAPRPWTDPERFRADGGFECGDGRTGTSCGWASCVAKFPSCDVGSNRSCRACRHSMPTHAPLP